MLRRGVLIVALAAATACGESSTGPSSIPGIYTLMTVNGDPVPSSVAYVEESATVTAVSLGELELEGNGTLTIALVVARTGSPGLGSLVFTGDYLVDGNSVAMTIPALGTRTGSFGSAGGRRTVVVDLGSGLGLFSFRKR